MAGDIDQFCTSVVTVARNLDDSARAKAVSRVGLKPAHSPDDATIEMWPKWTSLVAPSEELHLTEKKKEDAAAEEEEDEKEGEKVMDTKQASASTV